MLYDRLINSRRDRARDAKSRPSPGAYCADTLGGVSALNIVIGLVVGMVLIVAVMAIMRSGAQEWMGSITGNIKDLLGQ